MDFEEVGESGIPFNRIAAYSHNCIRNIKLWGRMSYIC
jgi:hypothetical protein